MAGQAPGHAAPAVPLAARLAHWAGSHRHFLIFAASIALTVAVHVWGTTNYWVSLAILAGGAAGVHQISNLPLPPGSPRKVWGGHRGPVAALRPALAQWRVSC